MQSKVIILHGRADYAAQVRSEMKLKAQSGQIDWTKKRIDSKIDE